MPTPSSSTVSSTVPGRSPETAAATRTRPPRGEYLTALDIRLEHAIHCVAIGGYRAQPVGHPALDTVTGMLRGEEIYVALDQLAEVHALRPELERAAGLDAGEVEEIGDDTAQTLRLGAHMAQIAPRPVRGHDTLEQELAEALERGQGRPQLMGNHGEELALRPVDLAQPTGRLVDLVLQLLGEAPLLEEEPRVLDGQRQMKRQLAYRAAGGRAKIAGALDGKDAHPPAPGVEREDEPP